MMKMALKKILPYSLWNVLRLGNRCAIAAFRRGMEYAGFTVDRKKNYYSPLPVVPELRRHRKRWDRPSQLAGIEYDLEEFKATLTRLMACYFEEFKELPCYDEICARGFGPGYPVLDALMLYLAIREHKPKRYVEVGSGVSTFYARLAGEANEKQQHQLHITCIEPHPFQQLYAIPHIQVHAVEVQSADLSLFKELDENDVLFIDSSHMLKIDSDVAFLFLEVLPRLNRGVFVHIHDVPFPYSAPYPADLWIFGQNWPMFWNEAMLLQAFLCFNRSFKIIMSTPLLRFHEESYLQRTIPIYRPVEQQPNTFSSIWLQKVD